jgi:hypothetical protein
MPTNDNSGTDYRVPLDSLDQAGEQGIGPLSSRRVVTTSILVAIATAAAIAALFIADPVTLVANVTASLVGSPSPQPGIDQPPSATEAAADAPPLTQAVADAQDLAPPANEAPKSDAQSDDRSDSKGDSESAVVAASEPATHQDQTATSRDQMADDTPQADALFRQFQAWAADQDAQASASPTQPAQDAPAQVEQDAPVPASERSQAQHRLVQRHRHVRAAHNAREETPAQSSRKARRVQTARAERRPVEDARAQDRSAQNPPVPNSQAPSLLPIFGQRN